MSVRYEASVTLGNVLTIVAILGSILAATANLSARLSILETKIMPLWEDYTIRAAQYDPAFYQKGKP